MFADMKNGRRQRKDGKARHTQDHIRETVVAQQVLTAPVLLDCGATHPSNCHDHLARAVDSP